MEAYLDFLDLLLSAEAQSKDLKRSRMGIQIAHFPVVRRLEDFDFSLQPSIDLKHIRELETGRFIANGENVLLLGPPGAGKTHLAIGLGRKAVEVGASALFVPALGLVAQLPRAESEGRLKERSLAGVRNADVLSQEGAQGGEIQGVRFECHPIARLQRHG